MSDFLVSVKDFFIRAKDFFVDLYFKAKDFCVDLYNKFINLSWVQWVINYCKENLMMACIIGGSVLLVLVTLIIIIRVATRKKRKAKKAAKKAKKLAKKNAKKAKKLAKKGIVAQPAVQEAPVAETSTVEETTAIEAPVAEATVEETTIEEVSTEAPAPAVEEAPVEAPTPVEEARVEESPVEETKDSTHEIFEMLASVDESTPERLRDNYEENETDKMARYTGKWVVCRVLTGDANGEEMYFFELHASNGEKLLSSEEYTTYQGALRGIQTHKTNILNGNVKITTTKKGDYIFKVLSGKNMLLCQGENYPTRARCESAVDSTVRFARTAVLDENVQDIVIKVPQEDNSPIAPLPDNSNGKWIILCETDENDQAIYRFELFANNGERLLVSEDYTTYIGAINGIQTYKNNVKKDNFRISLTKRGDYIYKVLNGNGQLLSLGEHYKTKRLCQNAVDSVKRFALNSPVLTEERK